jgi:hypothetical protein
MISVAFSASASGSDVGRSELYAQDIKDYFVRIVWRLYFVRQEAEMLLNRANRENGTKFASRRVWRIDFIITRRVSEGFTETYVKRQSSIPH